MFSNGDMYKNILLVPSFRRAGKAYIQLLTVAIGESLGDSDMSVVGKGGRGYLDK